MASLILPVAKGVYLCDEVVADVSSDKIHLLGAFNAIRPPEPSFPYRLGRLCVFAQLIGGAGETPIHVAVVHEETEEVVYESTAHPVRFTTRHTTVSVCVRILGCPFPGPGVYLVELYCGGQFLDDRALHVLNPPGSAS